MKFRNLIFLLLFLIVGLAAVSCVSANDLNQTSETASKEMAIDDLAYDSEISEDLVFSCDNDNLTSSRDAGLAYPNLDDGDNVIKAKTKTFADLNRSINGNNNKDVYLDGNYKFDFDFDLSFSDGVYINRPVTVHGNGHMIDGDNFARIFSVDCTGVVFRDIVFVNGHNKYEGGALYGECLAVNCSFGGNSASSGGAMAYGNATDCIFALNTANDSPGMYGGTAKNCIFFNNTAGVDGGALGSGKAFNCTFINNSASFDGGAVYFGICEKCTFIGNSASSGGAINHGSCVNCTFRDNRADDGGALYGCNAVNSIFISNVASNNGGAMCGIGFNATGCEFRSNSAKNGGATYGNNVISCKLLDNKATLNAGAVYGGLVANSIFKNNVAGLDGNDCYNITIPKSSLSVKNSTFSYDSGDKLLFSFKTEDGIAITNAEITISVYKNNLLVGTFYALGSGSWPVDLDVGSYVVVLSVDDKLYDVDSVNATLVVKKASTKIISSAVTSVYNDNRYLVVTLKDSKNKPISNMAVSVNLNGVKKLTTDKNGQVRLLAGSLVPKTYTASIKFLGNGNYAASSNSVKVTVKKATPKLTASNKAFKVNAVKKVTCILKDNKNIVIKNKYVTLRVNGVNYKVKTNSKGVATVTVKINKKGSFNTIIKFAGDAYYKPVSKTIKITVK